MLHGFCCPWERYLLRLPSPHGLLLARHPCLLSHSCRMKAALGGKDAAVPFTPDTTLLLPLEDMERLDPCVHKVRMGAERSGCRHGA